MDEIALIQNKIYEVKGRKVMLDYELAELYGVKRKHSSELLSVIWSALKAMIL